jgi:predicted nucleotidyltransferase
MLVELFKTEERARILRHVMFSSDFTVSEVSRTTGINKGLVSRYLRYLAERGIVRRDGRRYFPIDGALSRAVKLLLNLENIDLSSLSLGNANGLGLYGSWARGTNDQDSDLDVWISAEVLPSESDLARLQRDLSLQTGSEVNLLVLTPEKLERIKLEDSPFFNSLITGSMTLKGEPLEECR